MSDGRPLHVISGDQGFLPAPVSVKQLALAPGERREILIDMTNGDEVSSPAVKRRALLTVFAGSLNRRAFWSRRWC
jgi:FtsP/CotA-like multicopper oxidase with cupredoxin domain